MKNTRIKNSFFRSIFICDVDDLLKGSFILYFIWRCNTKRTFSTLSSQPQLAWYLRYFIVLMFCKILPFGYNIRLYVIFCIIRPFLAYWNTIFIIFLQNIRQNVLLIIFIFLVSVTRLNRYYTDQYTHCNAMSNLSWLKLKRVLTLFSKMFKYKMINADNKKITWNKIIKNNNFKNL